MKYCVVVPVKNEEKHVEETIKSLVEQTIRPQYVLFVDDGSTDKTPEIIDAYSKIDRVIHRTLYEKANEEKNSYRLGGHVVEIFNYGKRFLDTHEIEYDFIVKLDGDISFSNDFIQKIWNIIKLDDLWGIVSGSPYFVIDGKKFYDVGPKWHSRGQFKIYRKECLESIGGVPVSLGWDGADNIKAIKCGWKTASFFSCEYYMDRTIGGKFSSSKGRINHGIGAYLLGYDFLYFALRVLRNIFKPPYFVGSYYLALGYLKSMIRGEQRILNTDERSILRSLLWKNVGRKRKIIEGKDNVTSNSKPLLS